MATNNFKLFDENKANMLADGEYSTNTQRLNGVQTGVASSKLNNKFAYQVSLVAYAIAQLMNANGLDANDSAAVSTFTNNLSASLVQKVLDKATTAQIQAGTDNTKWVTPALVKAALQYFTNGAGSNVVNVPHGGTGLSTIANNTFLVGTGENAVSAKTVAQVQTLLGFDKIQEDIYPVGTIVSTVDPNFNDTMPGTWLLCNGESFSPTQYPDLAGKIEKKINSDLVSGISNKVSVPDYNYHGQIQYLGDYQVIFYTAFVNSSRTEYIALYKKESEASWNQVKFPKPYTKGYFNKNDGYIYLYNDGSLELSNSNKQIDFHRTKDFSSFNPVTITVEGTLAYNSPFIRTIAYNPNENKWIVGISFSGVSYQCTFYYATNLTDTFTFTNKISVPYASERYTIIFIMDNYYILIYYYNNMWTVKKSLTANFNNVDEQTIEIASDVMALNTIKVGNLFYVILAGEFYSIDTTKTSNFVTKLDAPAANNFGNANINRGIFYYEDSYYFTCGNQNGVKSLNYVFYPYKNSYFSKEFDDYIEVSEMCNNKMIVTTRKSGAYELTIYEFAVYGNFLPALSNEGVYYFIKASLS